MSMKCSRNPTKTKVTLLNDVSQDLNQLIELDKVCFLNGYLLNSMFDQIRYVRTCKFSKWYKLSASMSYKSEHLTRKKDITNAFNSFIAEIFNDVLHLFSREASSKLVKHVAFLQSLNEKLLLNAIQRT